MQKYLKSIFISIIYSSILLTTSCEYDADGDNYHDLPPFPERIGISVNLADIDPKETIYIYGPTLLSYQIDPEIGEVYSVDFKYDGVNIDNDGSFNSIFLNTSEMVANQIKDLEMDISIKATDNSLVSSLGGGYMYSSSASYKIVYVEITPKDFILKKADVDQITFEMINKNEFPCKFVFAGKEILDLDNIVLERNNFPASYTVDIFLLPPDKAIEEDFEFKYNRIQLSIEDNKLFDYYASSTIHYTSPFSKYLYTSISYPNKIQVYDKDLNVLTDKSLDLNISNINITPKTGLIVSNQNNGIVTYADHSFNSIISTIKSDMSLDISISNKDQLFQAHNFQVDVYDLHTSDLIYTIPVSEGAYDACIIGEYLWIKTHSNSLVHVYSLTSDRPKLIYTIEKAYWKSIIHPTNSNQIILVNGSASFEIFDLEKQEIIYQNKGRFESVDPLYGNIIYYDENYSYDKGKSKVHIIDKTFNHIYTFQCTTQSLYGTLILYGNYLLKNQHYIDLSSKLSQQ